MWAHLMQYTMFAALAAGYYYLSPQKPAVIEVPDKQYDYIIVGGGTAGSVIANRLSKNRNITVLVVEAGVQETSNPDVDIPVAAFNLRGTNVDWNYKTVPQKNACLGMENQECVWPRGKVLGGSSSINYLTYIRGSRQDYDEWAANGCDGWSYEDLLPYFLKSEDNQEHDMFAATTDYHANGGLLTINDQMTTELGTAFINAGKEKRYTITDDFNGDDHEGFGSTQVNMRKGRRWGVAKAFLRPVLHRENIHVLAQTRAVKIVIQDGRAIALDIDRGGLRYTVSVRHEIIVSAGTIGSPQLLMLSGIGPRKHLEKLQIPVKVDLPVGRNLQDHVSVRLKFIAKTPVSITPARLNSTLTHMEYSMLGTGYLSSNSGIEGMAFIRSKLQASRKRYPDIQLVTSSILLDNADNAREIYNFKEEIWNNMYGHRGKEYKNGFHINVVLLHPKSVGTIRLKSDNAFDNPLIDPNYLSNDDDVNTLLEGIKIVYSLLSSRSLKELGTKESPEILRQCVKNKPRTDAYRRCVIQYLATTYYDPTSTCKMGPENDPTSVVDPQLRVKGIQGLRVADASIIPNALSGNTHAPTVMIGEKAADLIKQTLQLAESKT